MPFSNSSVTDISYFKFDELMVSLRHHYALMVLDSTDQLSKDSRYSYMVFDPIYTLHETGSQFIVTSRLNDASYSYDSFRDAYQSMDVHLNRIDDVQLGPFPGGFMGAFSYEFYSFLETVPDHMRTHHDDSFPACFLGFYDRIIVWDHATNLKWFVQQPFRNHVASLADLFQSSHLDKFTFKTDKHMSVSYSDYCECVNRAKSAIYEGDTYQVNYSYPVKWSYTGHPLDLYMRTRQFSPTPYSAYMDIGFSHIMSHSPELFFSVTNQKIVTKPIKGTIARASSPPADDHNRDLLLRSEKDQAELMMIVDVERHDIGRLCVPGSVTVHKLKDIESFRYVHHLVSTIEGHLEQHVRFPDIMEAVFPGGSITGAPKYRSMDIIRSLESSPRRIYTGALGYIAPNTVKFNIAIRTMYTYGHSLYAHFGGGIVADSKPDLEWEETLIKAKGVSGLFDAKIMNK